MRRRLRQLKFDIAIDLQCFTKSAITAWLSGCRGGSGGQARMAASSAAGSTTNWSRPVARTW